MLKFASQVAHQLRSPMAAAGALLRALQDDYGGPLTEKQKDVIARAIARCDQAVDTSEQMMAIARVLNRDGVEPEVVDLEAVVRRKEQRYATISARRNVSLSIQILLDDPYISIAPAMLDQALDSVLDNAFKYTPDHGHIRLTVATGPSTDTVRISVADSGVGIPKAEQDKVATAFFRTSTARGSSRPGTGLGLALVKAVVDAAGGQLSIGDSDLGGAEITFDLPAAEAPTPATGGPAAPRPPRILIIGGVAAGPKAASKIIRMMPHAEVTLVEREKSLAYAGCGLPFYVSGRVTDQRELMSTPLGMVRDSVFFRNVKNVRVMDQTEALRIDRDARRVLIRDRRNDREAWLEYDKLLLATGARPMTLDVPGSDLDNIFTLHGVRDAEGIRATLAQTRAHDVVIVGGGLIGVEATEALVRKGCRVTIAEKDDRILNSLDPEIAGLIALHMEAHGVKILTGTAVESFRGDGGVQAVVTSRGELTADMVILSIGVSPNVALAADAGLDIGETGAIHVDARQQTSDECIYAAGDCSESVHLVTGKRCNIPRGSTAQKQGRVAAVNMAGGEDAFPGVLGSTVCKVFDYCVGWTGLSEQAAREAGFETVSVLAPAPDRAHFMPACQTILMKLVADAKTGRVLGCQVTGAGAGDKRLDVAAMAIAGEMTVDQLANVDLCYAPQYSEAMDNVHTAANIARNKLAGYMTGIAPSELHAMMDAKDDFVLLDVRSPREYERVRLPGATLMPLGALRGRMGELPPDTPIIAFCSISLRGYEAALVLRAAGFRDVRVLDGGIEMWPYERLYG